MKIRLTWWDMSALVTATTALALAMVMLLSPEPTSVLVPIVSGLCLAHSIFWLFVKRGYIKR